MKLKSMLPVPGTWLAMVVDENDSTMSCAVPVVCWGLIEVKGEGETEAVALVYDVTSNGAGDAGLVIASSLHDFLGLHQVEVLGYDFSGWDAMAQEKRRDERRKETKAAEKRGEPDPHLDPEGMLVDVGRTLGSVTEWARARRRSWATASDAEKETFHRTRKQWEAVVDDEVIKLRDALLKAEQ